MATAEQLETAAARRVRIRGAIRESITSRGYPPTLSELAESTGVDRETIKVDLRTLADAGVIEVDKGVTRGIRLKGYRVVLVPLPTKDAES
jgi:predicted transcriptional regulator